MMTRFLAILIFACVLGQGVRAQELFQGAGDVNPSEVDRVYVKGLQYLAKAQMPEGRWNEMPYGAEPAVVALAVVAMLAHGDDPNHGPYALPIKRGLDFVLKNMNQTTGYIGRSMYNHGFATLALAEAYGHVLDDRKGGTADNVLAGAESNVGVALFPRERGC